MGLQELINQLADLIIQGTAIPQFVALVLVLTQIAKPVASRLLSWYNGETVTIEGDQARMLALVVQIGVWGAYIASKSLGAEIQFTNWAHALETALSAFGQVLFPAVLTSAAASAGYNVLHQYRVPGFASSTKE